MKLLRDIVNFLYSHGFNLDSVSVEASMGLNLDIHCRTDRVSFSCNVSYSDSYDIKIIAVSNEIEYSKYYYIMNDENKSRIEMSERIASVIKMLLKEVLREIAGYFISPETIAMYDKLQVCAPMSIETISRTLKLPINTVYERMQKLQDYGLVARCNRGSYKPLYLF